MSGKNRIAWTTREKESIAARLVENGVVAADRGWRTAIVEAMQFCLPKERWRDPTSLNDSKKVFVPLMKDMAKRPRPSSPESVASAQMPVAELGFYSIDQLVNEIAQRLASTFGEHLRAEIAKTTASFREVAQVRHNPFPYSGNNKEGPFRVLIIGGDKDQHAELQRRCPNHELRFVRPEEQNKFIGERGATCHRAILWTNFIGHDKQQAAKSRLDLSIMTYYTGGIEGLVNKIQEMCK